MSETEKQPEPPMRVLFLCTHNSSRSQMAEGLLRARGGPTFEVLSAGTSPAFPAWRTTTTGSITIKERASPVSLAFKQVEDRHFSTRNHVLTFEAQQEKTLITHTQSTRYGPVGSMVLWIVLSILGHDLSTLLMIGEMVVEQQLLHIKILMESELNDTDALQL